MYLNLTLFPDKLEISYNFKSNPRGLFKQPPTTFDPSIMPSLYIGELVFIVDIWSWNAGTLAGKNHQFTPPSVETETAPPSQLNSVQTQLLKDNLAEAPFGKI